MKCAAGLCVEYEMLSFCFILGRPPRSSAESIKRGHDVESPAALQLGCISCPLFSFLDESDLARSLHSNARRKKERKISYVS
jgi:hypothetical protein